MDVVLATLFAVVAGIGTALSPCVLPVLPIVLAGGATGGRRRPLGIAVGLALTFSLATLALTYVIDALGLPDAFTRNLAIAALILAGVVLLVPPVADRVEARLSSWSGRFAPRGRTARGDGFGSGLALGGSLGLLYAPCAGPILAAVLTVQASQPLTAQRIFIGIGYALGAAAGVLLIATLGRRFVRRLAPRAGRLQQVLGGVMVAAAVFMVFELDLEFQRTIADDLPSALVNPTGPIEEAGAVSRALDRETDREETKPASEGRLPEYGMAPDFTGNQRWFNSTPLSLENLRGRVVLVDFWTYTCINCIRTLPYLKAWDERYRDAGLTIVGVHTPEFGFEKDPENVSRAVRESGLEYPIAQDNDFATWNAWSNQYWPAKYLIDARGQVRYYHFGEGSYDETEKAIRSLLAEAGRDAGATTSGVEVEKADTKVATPETYLGFGRAEGFANGPIGPGEQDFGARSLEDTLRESEFAFRGKWFVSKELARSRRGARLELRFQAKKVFLVMGPVKKAGNVEVFLDGERVKTVRVARQQLYRLVELPEAGDHVMRLEFDSGLDAFAFTFG